MKNANLKRLFALTLALTMSVGIFTGCGSQGEKKEETETNSSVSKTSSEAQTSETSSEAPVEELEPVTLQWYYDGAEKEGTADVIEVFNEKLAEVLPNTTVEFTFVSDYQNNWPLLLAGGEEMDIAWAGYKTPYMQDVLDGSIMGISELVKEYAPNLVEEWEIWQPAYDSATYEGELYGIPSVQPTVSEAQCFQYNQIMNDYLDVDALVAEFRSNMKLTSKMLDLIEEGIQAAIDAEALKVGDGSWIIYLDGIANQGAPLGYKSLGNRLFFDPEAKDPVPMHLWELPGYKMAIERLAKWYEKGWITESQLLGQVEGAVQVVRFAAADKWNTNWANCDENGIQFIPSTKDPKQGYYQIATNKPEEGYVGVDSFGSESTYQVIPYTSENPERAIMLLNLLHDEPGTVGNDLLNLLCYGFEENSEEAKKYGWFNYTAVEEDGQLKVDISTRGERESMHGMTNWILGNTYKTLHDGGSLTTVKSKEYAMNFYTDVYPLLKRTPLSNMIVDYSSLNLEIQAIKTVWEEYDSQLIGGCGGIGNVDALYEEALTKLKEAGLDKVKTELQAQIDAYTR